MKTGAITIAQRAESRIFMIRSQRVMLNSDLAELYGVETRALKQAVRRNLERCPEVFMFELSGDEIEGLRSQNVISSSHGGSRHGNLAFTEQGVAMLSGVLRSERAVQVNIAIMRAFVRLRQLLAAHVELAKKLEEMERKYDGQFRVVFDALRQLMSPPVSDKPRREIGYHTIASEKSSKSAKNTARAKK